MIVWWTDLIIQRTHLKIFDAYIYPIQDDCKYWKFSITRLQINQFEIDEQRILENVMISTKQIHQ